MSSSTASVLRIVVSALATGAIGLPAVWAGLALWYAVPDSQVAKILIVAAWAVFSAGMLLLVWQSRMAAGVGAFAVLFVAVLIWWLWLPATNDAVWADDVSRITTGVVERSNVTLYNVRNFDWRTTTDYTQRWETRTYDLDRLASVDMIMSYWSGRAIAHMLMSFGFEDGSHVVFSVEIRRRKTQEFSELGGFFKEFELSIIAADERDIVRVRTNVRGEDDYLYQLRLPASIRRSLFLGYVAQANALVTTPRFYNTITVNCTTLVYEMMKKIVGHLPLDYRLLISGYLPEYVYSVGGLNKDFSLDELRARGRITERARESDRSEHFSADIRRGLPPMLPPAD